MSVKAKDATDDVVQIETRPLSSKPISSKKSESKRAVAKHPQTKRPPGLMCSTCAGKILHASKEQDLAVFQLKLRDWLGVDSVELRPCLSVCPEAGIAVERRGKQMVLGREEIEKIHAQFDPTRQLTLF